MSKSFINSGIAVISFDLSSTFTWPIDIPISLRKAKTLDNVSCDGVPFLKFNNFVKNLRVLSKSQQD